jgi:hypothetical protein
VIKITNEVDGKKYELVKAEVGGSCDGCVMKGKPHDKCRAFSLLWGYGICVRLNGIWKEVRDAD